MFSLFFSGLVLIFSHFSRGIRRTQIYTTRIQTIHKTHIIFYELLQMNHKNKKKKNELKSCWKIMNMDMLTIFREDSEFWWHFDKIESVVLAQEKALFDDAQRIYCPEYYNDKGVIVPWVKIIQFWNSKEVKKKKKLQEKLIINFIYPYPPIYVVFRKSIDT